MSIFFNAFNHKEWASYNLADYCEFSEKISEIRQRLVGDCMEGDWYFIDDNPHTVEGQGVFRVIYHGSFGNYNSPGAKLYTNASMYDIEDADDMANFEKHKAELESAPEWLESDEEDEDEFDEEEDDDEFDDDEFDDDEFDDDEDDDEDDDN